MLTKCAKLISCTKNKTKDSILYSAETCDGDEKFIYFSEEKEKLADTCPVNSLVSVSYDPMYCYDNHVCYTEHMELITDNHCAAECLGW